MGDRTVHFLMFVRVISYRSPSFSTSCVGLALTTPFSLGARASKKLSGPEKISSTPVQPARISIPAMTPPAAGLPPKRKAFSICSASRSEEHTSELQSRLHIVCRLLLEL